MGHTNFTQVGVPGVRHCSTIYHGWQTHSTTAPVKLALGWSTTNTCRTKDIPRIRLGGFAATLLLQQIVNR